MDEFDPKARYVLHYSTDLSTPRGTGPSRMVPFRSWFRYLLYVLRNSDAQKAIRAGRFRLLEISPKESP